MTSVLMAFDTSTERASVALVVDGRPWLADCPGGAATSEHLLPTAHRLLRGAGLDWGHLTGLGYGQGPGAFTGLRTACSVVQGLALGLDVPVWALDTLQAVVQEAHAALVERGAVQEPPAGAVAWCLQDARMGEMYAARFRWVEARWCADAEPKLISAMAWATSRCESEPAKPVDRTVDASRALADVGEPDWCWAGSAVEEALRSTEAGASVAASGRGPRHAMTSSWPSPRAMARLLVEAHASRPGGGAADVRPRYVRNKVALTVTERALAAESSVAR